MNRRIGARPWLAHAQDDYGRLLLARDRSGDRVAAGELFDAALETPPTIPLLRPEVSSPRLGEQLSGTDRSWLALGSSVVPAAQASSGEFDWGDAGIGAGFAGAVVVLGAGTALAVRRRMSLAH